MSTITRDEFVERLTNEWGNYVAAYQRLSPEEQRNYVQKQGYARFADVLAHVVAWWKNSQGVIADMQQNTSLPLADYDVDLFNDQAVYRFAGKTEEQALTVFETRRLEMLALVNALTDEELYQKNINLRLYYEILMHWKEHEMSAEKA